MKRDEKLTDEQIAGYKNSNFLDQAVKNLMEDMKLSYIAVIALINDAIVEINQILNEMEEAVAVDDISRISRGIHNLKGIASMFRSDQMQMITNQMNQCRHSDKRLLQECISDLRKLIQ